MIANRIEFSVHHDTAYDVTVGLSADASITEVVDAFRAFLLAAGYGAENVQEYLPE